MGETGSNKNFMHNRNANMNQKKAKDGCCSNRKRQQSQKCLKTNRKLKSKRKQNLRK